MSFVASMMKMTEIKSENISSVKRVKNSTMLDKENKLWQREEKGHTNTKTDQTTIIDIGIRGPGGTKLTH